MNKDYDVIILGAGPAGSCCALALKDSGLKVALIDKSQFPRNKTCGDAIPGPSLKTLKQLLGETLATKELTSFELKQQITSSHLFSTKGSRIEINWKTEAYNSSRFAFDNFLLNLVKKHTKTSIYEGVGIKEIEKSEHKIYLKGKTIDTSFNCKFLVGCDGANSIVAKTFTKKPKPQLVAGIAIRQYYENIKTSPKTNEFYALEGFQGYFWIFPLKGNLYNVGLGLIGENLDSKAKKELKKVLQDTIENNSLISGKFKNAKPTSKIEGFKLPAGGKKRSISGERFILTGDAANLIDPLQGHGIDKAMKSGMIAAVQIEKCFQQNDFSSNFISEYDTIVSKIIAKELKRNLRLMNILKKFPWLLSLLFLFLKKRS